MPVMKTSRLIVFAVESKTIVPAPCAAVVCGGVSCRPFSAIVRVVSVPANRQRSSSQSNAGRKRCAAPSGSKWSWVRRRGRAGAPRRDRIPEDEEKFKSFFQSDKIMGTPDELAQFSNGVVSFAAGEGQDGGKN